MESFSRKILIISIIAALAVGFGVGFFFWNSPTSTPIKNLINRNSTPANIDFSLFWSVWDKLSQKYVDQSKLDQGKMVYGAIEGMVNSIGDPYTVFFEPAESKKFQEEISGSFGGVGIEIAIKNNVLTVIAPLKNTPADRAGIMTGDKILKIDSKPTSGLSADEAVDLIRGKNGTKVTLTIVNSKGVSKDIPLIRENIKIPTTDLTYIDQGNGKKTAYLQIYAFNENVDSEFQKETQDILKSNASSLILDLRNNPGGLLDSAVNIAGWFLQKDQVVTIEDMGNGVQNAYKADGNGLLKLPVVVLINGGSASASEILAGALHDDRGVKLIGEKSFGKGSVQELENFNDGSSLKITVAKWLTPSGVSISEKGITPDITVALPTDDKSLSEITIGQQGKDPQLDRALEYVR